MRNRKLFAAGALALAGSLLLLAGCSSSTEPKSEAKSGGSITVAASGQGIPQLNPVISTFAFEETLYSLLWNGLVDRNEAGKLVPDLATTWEASPDQTTWTFNLRDGVEFLDGKNLTAADVVDTFKIFMDPETGSSKRNRVAMVTEVNAVDDLTVEFKLSKPVAIFAEGLDVFKIVDVSTLDQIDTSPNSTGPFKVAEFIPDQSVTLIRNDNYFGEPAVLDEIKLVNSGDATAGITALRSGDIDALWSVPQSDVSPLRGESNIQLLQADGSQWISWEMDTTSAPFNDVRARQAVAYATDREAILEAAYYGVGTLAPGNSPLAENHPDFGGDLVTYTYDLDKAKALFAEAGVNEGDSIVWWGVGGAYPEWNTSGEILQASLKEIGINLDIQNNDIGTWVSLFYPAGKSFPNTIVPNRQAFPPVPSAYTLSFLLSGRCECNWTNPDFEAAYAAAIAEPDPDKRSALWAEVQTQVSKDVPVIVPLQSAIVSAVSTSVDGIWSRGDGVLRVESASRN